MKKRFVIPAVGVLVSTCVGYWIKMRGKNSENNFTNSLEKAGRPDQLENEDLAQLENAKMVSEGSQFGVQYYNKTSQGEKEALENK